RLRANSTWAMLEFVFNGMVFLLLGLQLPGILESSLAAAEADPTFLSLLNLSNILTQSSVRIIIALGVAGLIVTQGTDLSAGR
ncbi:hypothetical protein MJI37_35975, partial [Salmonella enterica subsp. enterica serovar Cerro]|nr:hypothetical protein [Salmonella enterica subsp. enterica serovar Cerro]